MEISSVANPKIVEFSKLSEAKYRNKTGLFSVEGQKVLEDILDNDIKIENVFSTLEKIPGLPENIDVIKVSQPVIKKLCSSSSAPKIVTIAHKREFSPSEIKKYKKILLLDSINDPGNLGTLIRSLVAFGFEALVLYGNCVDEYNPKVLRSCTGNFFKIPIFKISRLEKAVFGDFTFLTTDLHMPANDPAALDLPEKFVLALGSEARGLSIDFSKFETKNVLLKTEKVESLNLSVSGSILMYELSKKF